MFTSSQLRTSAFLALLSGFLAASAVNASPVMSSRQNNGASKYVSPLDNWTTTGCVQDGWPNNRVLEGAGYLGSDSLTIEQCLQYCDTQGAHLAGVEAGNQCFCGPTLLNGGLVGPNGANLNNNVNDGCNVDASGSNGSQNGGGQNHLLLFTSTTRPEPTIATVQGAKYQGCYKDDEANRLLPVWAQGNDAGNTASKCAEECKSLDSSYDLFGVEYRQECHCGKSSEVNLRQDLLGEGCVQTCTGDEGTICGGGGWLSVYRSD